MDNAMPVDAGDFGIDSGKSNESLVSVSNHSDLSELPVDITENDDTDGSDSDIADLTDVNTLPPEESIIDLDTPLDSETLRADDLPEAAEPEMQMTPEKEPVDLDQVLEEVETQPDTSETIVESEEDSVDLDTPLEGWDEPLGVLNDNAKQTEELDDLEATENTLGQATDVEDTFQSVEGNEADIQGETEELAEAEMDTLRFGELSPDSTYNRNGYLYETDELGRVSHVRGDLRLENGERDLYEQSRVGHIGNEGDEGGHIIGTRFDGSKEGVNLIPQDMNLNRSQWKVMENEWDRALQDGKEVYCETDLVYDDDGLRPMGLVTRYEIDGEPHTKTFLNQAHGEVGYDR